MKRTPLLIGLIPLLLFRPALADSPEVSTEAEAIGYLMERGVNRFVEEQYFLDDIETHWESSELLVDAIEYSIVVEVSDAAWGENYLALDLHAGGSAYVEDIGPVPIDAEFTVDVPVQEDTRVLHVSTARVVPSHPLVTPAWLVGAVYQAVFETLDQQPLPALGSFPVSKSEELDAVTLMTWLGLPSVDFIEATDEIVGSFEFHFRVIYEAEDGDRIDDFPKDLSVEISYSPQVDERQIVVAELVRITIGTNDLPDWIIARVEEIANTSLQSIDLASSTILSDHRPTDEIDLSFSAEIPAGGLSVEDEWVRAEFLVTVQGSPPTYAVELPQTEIPVGGTLVAEISSNVACESYSFVTDAMLPLRCPISMDLGPTETPEVVECDLAGLPPGLYRFAATFSNPHRHERRYAYFTIVP